VELSGGINPVERCRGSGSVVDVFDALLLVAEQSVAIVRAWPEEEKEEFRLRDEA
jgi:hypothetical protein